MSAAREVPPLFADRRDAGRVLSRHLEGERGPGAVVVGLARGGVPVAAEVARSLGVPLDALVVRKVGHPMQPELAVGAVAAGGDAEPPPARRPRGADAAFASASADAGRMEARLRARVGAVPLGGATCILVDDGLATGATMAAAVRRARGGGARRVVVAAPVGARETVARLGALADAVVCPHPLSDLRAVGLWYDDFGQVPEGEVVAALRASRGAPAG